MFFWGLFALLYCLLIPGLAVMALAPVIVTAPSTVALAVGLSLIFNMLSVAILYLTGFYSSSVVTSVAIIVSAAAVLIIANRVLHDASTDRTELRPKTTALDQFAVCVLSAVIGYHFVRAALDFGNIFRMWDAVVSWNRWAVEWSQQTFPTGAYDYPQLLPTVWSLTYLIIGTSDIQIFAKAIVAWLPLAAALAFYGMWQEERSATAVVGAVAFTVLLGSQQDLAIAGYAEFPTAILAFVAYFAAWVATRRSGREADWLAMIGAVVAAGAGTCKQGGLYFAIFYPFFFFVVGSNFARRLPMALGAGLLILSILCFSYGLRFIAGPPDQSVSVAPALAFSIHGQATVFEKISRSLMLLRTQWLTPPLFIPLAILCLCAVRTQLGRLLIFGCVLPPLIIYVLFFGYDIRNAVFCAPFLAWASGLGFHRVISVAACSKFDWLCMGRQFLPGPGLSVPRLTFVRVLILCSTLPIIAFIGLAVQARSYPTESFLRAHQTQKSWKIGYKRLNECIRSWMVRENVQHPILTNYTVLKYIPDIKGLYAEPTSPHFSEIDKDIDTTRARFVLDISSDTDHARIELTRLVAAGRLIEITDCQGHGHLYRVIGR